MEAAEDAVLVAELALEHGDDGEAAARARRVGVPGSDLVGALPHRALRDLARRHGPLMTLRLGELDATVASSPEALMPGVRS